MSITNVDSGTNIVEIVKGIYRINTPVPPSQVPGGFSFNQYLIVDEEPLLFHTGPRKLFGLVREAVTSVMPVERLRYISFSHMESDECGTIGHIADGNHGSDFSAKRHSIRSFLKPFIQGPAFIGLHM